jgi:hypothetical protein
MVKANEKLEEKFNYRNYEKKDKETLEYQEKTEKNKKELDDFMNKNFEKM